MKNYIFGYGSLINPISVSLSLRRDVKKSDMQLSEVKNFIRSWGSVIEVQLYTLKGLIPINAVFLDIQEKEGQSVNGILIDVSQRELENMDIREKQYERVDITGKTIYPKILDGSSVYTYIGTEEFSVKNYTNVKVLYGYQKIVYEGISYWGREFSNVFHSSTLNHSFELIHGQYKFLDDNQNILTGRK